MKRLYALILMMAMFMGVAQAANDIEPSYLTPIKVYGNDNSENRLTNVRTIELSDVTLASLSTTITIDATATVYTKAIALNRGEYFTLSYIATASDGAETPDLLIQMEQSFTLPATEGSADANYVVPENMSNIETNLITETMHHKVLSPAPLKYMRLKITGNASNPADNVTIRIRLSIQVNG